MNMENPVTGTDRYCSCPYCEAIFRLPDKTYRHKGGIVRCGACRKVFDSNVNLVIRSGGKFVPISTTRPVTHSLAVPESAEKPDDDPETQIDSISVSGGLFDEGDAVTHFPETDVEFSRNEFWESGPDSEAGPNLEVPPDQIRNPFSESAKVGKKDRSQEQKQRKEPSFSPLNLDEEPRRDADRETVYSEQLSREASDSEVDGDGLIYGTKDLAADYHDQVDDDHDIRLITNGVSESNLSPLSVNSMMNSEALDDSSISRMSREGVDKYIKDRRNPVVTFVWFAVALIFLVLLGLQVKYFFVEKYSQNAQYRGYLAVFCKVAACELPPRIDPHGFTLTHTKIDLHPSEPGALRVTVKLVNEANFAQPYPSLQLTLTDRVGRVVGRRTFSPEYYLPADKPNMLGRGELAALLFDLARPHEKAVGFVVDVVKTRGA